VLGVVEFHKRYDESNLYAKRVIEEGAIGKVRYFTVEYSQRISIPSETFRAWVRDTNIFQYLGVHYVDLIHFMTGARPVRALAVGTRGDWIDPNTSTAVSDQKYTVVGSAGRLELDQKDRGIQLVREGHGLQSANPYFSDFLPAPDGGQIFQGYAHRSIATFLEDVADVQAGRIGCDSLEPRRPTFRQGLISTGVIEAVNRSLASDGRWIDIPDVFEDGAGSRAGGESAAAVPRFACGRQAAGGVAAASPEGHR